MGIGEKLAKMKEASARFRTRNITVTMTGEEWEHIGHCMVAGAPLNHPQCVKHANFAKFGNQLNKIADECGLPSVEETRTLKDDITAHLVEDILGGAGLETLAQ